MSQWNERKQRRNKRRKSNKRPRALRIARQASSRRGVLLLVVLSMLTLFLMIGTAYIVTANQYRRAQKAYAQASLTSEDTSKHDLLVNEVFNQLLRDTNNQYSSFRYHSLLRDLYGNDGIVIQPNSLIRFIERSNTSAFGYTDDYGSSVDITTLDDRMNLTGNQFFWVAVEFTIPDPITVINPSPLSLVDNFLQR